MRIEDTVCQKLNPAQRRQIANILGWIAALLIFPVFICIRHGGRLCFVY